LIALAVTLWFAPAVFGQQLAVDFDPATTKINWSLAGNVHTTHGTFQLKRGHVDVDVATNSIAGELVVETESGESGNSARDKRMKKEILETDKYPEVRFKVIKMEGILSKDRPSTVRVYGQFTIHGSSHEVIIPLQLSISGSEVNGTGKLVVPYVDWGMKDPSNFLFKVDKTVSVELIASGHITH
jgi:polyisoprenoid-binding protein YceI